MFALLGVLALARLRRDRLWAFVPLGALVAATVLEATLKIALAQPGPPLELSRTTALPAWLPWPRAHFDFSYPSGHALRAAFLLVLAAGASRAVAIGGAAFAVAVWLTRVYAAEHWPTDVLGGLLLGIAAAGIARAAADGVSRRRA